MNDTKNKKLPNKLRTRIHLDIASFKKDDAIISKKNISSLVYGLFKHALKNSYYPPYYFTATCSSDNISILGNLRNNNVQIVENIPDDVDFCFNATWSKLLFSQLGMEINYPVDNATRACIYVDWDNIKVSLLIIPKFISALKEFVHNRKMHNTYLIYIFIPFQTSQEIKNKLSECGVDIINLVKDKTFNSDAFMIQYIRRNTQALDTLCVVSGDRDFSPIMVEMVHNLHNVFLVYNVQAIYTFKNNKHWLKGIDIKSILTESGINLPMGSSDRIKKLYETYSRSSGKSNKKHVHTKPCKYYNLGNKCRNHGLNEGCKFLHVCGYCGDDHPLCSAHGSLKQYSLKNTVCDYYNSTKGCKFSANECKCLHVCKICNKQCSDSDIAASHGSCNMSSCLIFKHDEKIYSMDVNTDLTGSMININSSIDKTERTQSKYIIKKTDCLRNSSRVNFSKVCPLCGLEFANTELFAIHLATVSHEKMTGMIQKIYGPEKNKQEKELPYIINMSPSMFK